MSTKAITPVRRSRSGRGPAGDEVPSSIELLPPEATSSPSVSHAFEPGELWSRSSMAGPAPPIMQRSKPSNHHRSSHVVMLSATRPLDHTSGHPVNVSASRPTTAVSLYADATSMPPTPGGSGVVLMGSSSMMYRGHGASYDAVPPSPGFGATPAGSLSPLPATPTPERDSVQWGSLPLHPQIAPPAPHENEATAAGSRGAAAGGGSSSGGGSWQQQQQQPHGLSWEGDGGSVYGDAESQQAPGTPHSVASGRVGQSGVFFTALHRSFGDDAGLRESMDDDGMSMVSARSHLMDTRSMISHANPMQSPDMSDDEDALRGDEGGAGAGEDEEADHYMDAYDDDGQLFDQRSEWSNPMMTPRESVQGGEVPSRMSLLSMINDLYSAATLEQEERELRAQQLQRQQEDADISATQPSSPRPDTAATEPPAPDAPAAEASAAAADGGDNAGAADAGDDDDSGAAVEELRGSIARVDEVLAEQEKRRAQLGQYMQELKDKVDESGERLVELPANYLAMVEKMIRQRRGEYTALQGWMGPRRFDELPINQLPDDHPDPRVHEGLMRVKELDAKLSEKTIEAMILKREMFPEQWAEQERKRLEAHSRKVEEALKKERMKRMRAAKLSRIVTSFDGVDGLLSAEPSVAQSVASSRVTAVMGPSYNKYFVLRPDEEALVEVVLHRKEDEEVNPFDISFAMDLTVDQVDPSLAGPPAGAAAAMQPDAADGAAEDGSSQGGAGAGAAATAAEDPDSSAAAAAAAAAAAGPSSSGRPLTPSLAAAAAALPVSRLPLAVINAKLEEYAQEHVWDADGSLADFASLSSVRTAAQQQGGAGGSAASVSAAAAAGAGGLPPPPMSVIAPSSHKGSQSTTLNGKRDYLREEREAKELVQRENDLDARIRAFKTSAPLQRLTGDQLSQLIQECKALQELASQRSSSNASAAGGGSKAPSVAGDAATGGMPSSSGGAQPPALQRQSSTSSLHKQQQQPLQSPSAQKQRQAAQLRARGASGSSEGRASRTGSDAAGASSSRDGGAGSGGAGADEAQRWANRRPAPESQPPASPQPQRISSGAGRGAVSSSAEMHRAGSAGARKTPELRPAAERVRSAGARSAAAGSTAGLVNAAGAGSQSVRPPSADSAASRPPGSTVVVVRRAPATAQQAATGVDATGHHTIAGNGQGVQPAAAGLAVAGASTGLGRPRPRSGHNPG